MTTATDVNAPAIDLVAYWRDRLSYPTQPESLELHLSSGHSVVDDATKVTEQRNDFARIWGARIRAVGGTYRPVRSTYDRYRFVKLPATADAIALADELLKADDHPKRAPDVLLCYCKFWRMSHDTARRDAETIIGRGRSIAEALTSAGDTLTRMVNNGSIAASTEVAGLEAADRAERDSREARIAAEKAEAERIAKLNGAAPEMLVALREVLAHFEAQQRESKNVDTIARYFADKTRAVIAKATE